MTLLSFTNRVRRNCDELMLHHHPGLKLKSGMLLKKMLIFPLLLRLCIISAEVLHIHLTHYVNTPFSLPPQPQVCMLNNPFPHASVVSLMTGGSEHLAVNHPARVLPHPQAAQTAHRGSEWHRVPHLRTLDLRLTICRLCCSCQSPKEKKGKPLLPLGISCTSHPVFVNC